MKIIRLLIAPILLLGMIPVCIVVFTCMAVASVVMIANRPIDRLSNEAVNRTLITILLFPFIETYKYVKEGI